MKKFVGVLLGVFILFGIFVLDRSQKVKEGLNIGNLNGWSIDGPNFILANSSDNFGDVVLWVVQDGMIKCEHVVNVRANYRYQLTLPCRNIGEGKYEVRWGWADYYEDRAAVAKRININY